MRNLYLALIASVLFAQFSCGPTYVVQSSAPPPQAPPAPEATYQNFYDALSPYGEWINNPEYGYVWMPNAGPDFKPYATNGNWVYTEEGWAWNSNYAWGWAPFHYGRWFYEDGYGWMWMPGNEWAPAWVTWRRSPDYYGWAPLGPNVSMTVAVGGGYNPPPHYWCFVPHQYVTSPHMNNYYVNEQQNVTIINNTTVIHNTTIVNNNYNNTTVVNNRGNNNRVTVNNYAGGPDAGEVARVTGASLRPVAVVESNMPGANRTEGSFAIYRPRINTAPQGNSGNTGNGGAAFHPAPAPTRIQTLNNVRPVNTTIYSGNRGPGNNTTINNTTINNNTTNTNITNNNNANNNNTNNNIYNNSRPNPNPNNPGQQGNPNEFRPNGQQGNPNEFHRNDPQPNGQQPNNTRFIPGSTTNNGNPAVTPATTGAAGNTFQPQPNNRLPATGAGNGTGPGYRNNGNGNGNGNGLRVNGNASNGNNGNNGNGRGNGGSGNVRPAPPGTGGSQVRPFPKPKDTTRRANGRP